MNDDDKLLDVVCKIVAAANGSEDQRLLQLMDASIQMLSQTSGDLLPVLLLRYDALKKREEELEGQMEEMYADSMTLTMRGRLSGSQDD